MQQVERRDLAVRVRERRSASEAAGAPSRARSERRPIKCGASCRCCAGGRDQRERTRHRPGR
eukprot:4358288-Prymnesium_polylepis.2